MLTRRARARMVCAVMTKRAATGAGQTEFSNGAPCCGGARQNMANAILTDEVKDVLSRATVSGNAIILPPRQLDRGLYEKVNKALANAGGQWKRGTGHVFPVDAAPKLAAMLGTGVSVDEKKRNQAFMTPPHLAKRVVDLAEVSGRSVLEPEAGNGALAVACWLAGASTVDCIEQNGEHEKSLSAGFGDVFIRDFLSVLPADLDKEPYERIVMNPPFTKNQDIQHVRHALKWLAPGGILTAIMLNNQTRKGFVDLNVEYEPEIEEIERGAFRESGTDVPTLILKIDTREPVGN
jgi:16S rRNA G966 N2-methylase RsmD